MGQSEFVTRYGDRGEDEFSPQGGTIPQQLLMMNGELLKKRTEDNLIGNAATQIAALASTDEKAIETADLACLSAGRRGRNGPDFAERCKARAASNVASGWRTCIGPYSTAPNSHGTTRSKTVASWLSGGSGTGQCRLADALGRSAGPPRRTSTSRASAIRDIAVAGGRRKPVGNVRSASRRGDRGRDACDSHSRQGHPVGRRF